MATVKLYEPWRGIRSAHVLVACAVVVCLVLLVHANEAGLAQIGSTVNRAHYWWVVPALAAEVVSLAALAAQQRRLLAVQGGNYSLRAVAATTCASTTISTSLASSKYAPAIVASVVRPPAA